MTIKFYNLTMRIIFAALLGWATLGVSFGQSQERDLNVYPYWKYYSNVSNTLYEILAERAFDQLEERESLVSKLRTRQDWQERQSSVKSILADIVGPFP